MKLLRYLLTLLTLMLCTLTLQAQQTTHLEGRVMLNDTLPAAYATLYLPQFGMGTVTDEQGHYQLDNIPVGSSVTLEYAFLGYKTEQVKVDLSQPNHRYAHDQRLTEQAIQLNEVYLTPNGEDPCIYIMRKLHEQGQINRKRLKTYTAVCSGKIDLENLDVIMAILPGILKTAIHAALRLAGFNTLFNYLTSSEKVHVDYRYTQTWNHGKVKNSEMEILSATPAMDKKVRKKMDKLQIEDLFAQFYGDDKKFDAKKTAKKNWHLKGVIEENGKTIDVLTRTVGDSIKSDVTVYIIEDLWSVLRFEIRSKKLGIHRFECSDIGGGIYLPVLFVTNPIPLDFAEFMKDQKKEYEADKAKGKDSKLERKIIERYEKLEKSRATVNINIVTPYSVRYSNVTVE